MPKLAANLSMLFNEVPFLDRFEAAAMAGFEAVEYLFPYDYEVADLRQRLNRFDLSQALFNAPPGDWAAGERGIACLPGREREFMEGIEQALEYAAVLGNRHIHVMAGRVPDHLAYDEAHGCYVDNLRRAAQRARQEAVTLLIEPINYVDMPGYFISLQEDAVALIDEIDEPNVRLQFDCYHCQIMQGNVIETFRNLLPYIGHLQIAGVPGRHEPDIGELHYPYIFEQIEASGYDGYIGCEYHPRANTVAGLGWLQAAMASDPA
ncbi:2-oxo-tetronate isomerase [Marinobacterium aestuariivivens]|uniref:2-oxo-tetronate isomerase n=1 Tax=Marinobacterium aestuariivivens TaxID=1698799 RepID=A0ABW2A5P7_9GAMM